MPRKYLIEMVCDWRSFSRKWGRKVKPATLDLSEKIVLHPDTKKELEMIMKRKREEDARNTAVKLYKSSIMTATMFFEFQTVSKMAVHLAFLVERVQNWNKGNAFSSSSNGSL
ncbi:hypothetical protein BN000_02886 [Neobacillus massiliamazoniensis]|uniref:Uncharacterized protein n=1 Tax=Neobacillus massiliamazoniensis TaxID=1499688 RepID=A0A0U1NY20_9BACI|nr:hypothetical protein BN000_02886 [Neobacillus massiliamazoniensis]